MNVVLFVVPSKRKLPPSIKRAFIIICLTDKNFLDEYKKLCYNTIVQKAKV